MANVLKRVKINSFVVKRKRVVSVLSPQNQNHVEGHICGRRWADEPEQCTRLVTGALLFSSSLVSPLAHCVRISWLIKRLLCRLRRHSVFHASKGLLQLDEYV